MRAVSIKVAKDMGRTFEDSRFIVAHMGGGSSVALFDRGKMRDTYKDDEGPFSVQRTGGLPVTSVVKLMDQYSASEIKKLYKTQGGVVSYLGTSDLREVEERVHAGDVYARLVLDTYIYQHAKAIASLAAYTGGQIDGIILTGGVANSDYITQELSRRVEFLAPVAIEAGEHEMIALAQGAHRVLEGHEDMKVFEYKEEKEYV